MATRARADVEATISIRRPYKATFSREDGGGYSARVEGLPGCYSEGDTLAEARRNIREAIEGFLEAREILARRAAAGGGEAAKARPPKVKSR